MQALPALAERQRAKVRSIGPQNVKGDIGGRLRAPEKIVELRPAGCVDRDHLAIENRLVEVEHGRKLVAESVEAGEVVAVARDEPAAVPLDIVKTPALFAGSE